MNNWEYERGMVFERDIKALERAKNQEEDNIKNGHRYIKVNKILEILVPCDKNGVPTKKGEMMIKILKESQGIK